MPEDNEAQKAQRDNIWFEPGTRLHMIVHHAPIWEIWIATNKRTGPSSQWLGTFLRLHPNGRVEQVTRYDDLGEQSIEIREAQT